MLCNQLEKFVKKGEEETRFLLKKKSIITFDNFFSGEVIMDWCRKKMGPSHDLQKRQVSQ